ncbi:DUF554 domain-containing protein [Lactobacillus sp. LC28-10]|uniref:DUF554 domain-containing protein n=1 Tax=Secundilactobacillus angelensis TaxID=2722706 RepID=A0ABX1KVB5_9LACO|nr:DUF554 domain-containing protein [Secundilactobacillus angelensis]MCH5461566.1 DUF554 domain-containing protein [Secundilactobacillus angelensis]NLR17861.1 DUF554 domain-containing protein [Secundilactobacillus angelensis]
MILFGALANGLAVVLGGGIGLAFKQGISERIKTLVMQSLGICVVYVGISGSLKGTNTIFVVVSMVIGAIIGELIDFDTQFNKFGDWLEKLMGMQGNNHFSEGFVTGTLFICVGAMAIVGSLQSGMTGNNQVLYTKSMIDGIFVLILATTLGLGVAFSAISVVVYESVLTLLAKWVAPLFTHPVINAMTVVGSLLILIIGLNMLKLTKIKVANLLLAPFIPILLFAIFK